MEKQILTLLLKGSLTVSDISKSLKLTDYKTKSLVSVMAGKGWVELPEPRKHKGISITNKGKQELNKQTKKGENK